jgi:hypothetical protein
MRTTDDLADLAGLAELAPDERLRELASIFAAGILLQTGIGLVCDRTREFSMLTQQLQLIPQRLRTRDAAMCGRGAPPESRHQISL